MITMLAMASVAFFFIVCGFVILDFCIMSRTKKYRKNLTDLYVAGRIRQLATEDKIDLNLENEMFKAWVKKSKFEEKSLDNAIEEDLKDKIADKPNKKI